MNIEKKDSIMPGKGMKWNESVQVFRKCRMEQTDS